MASVLHLFSQFFQRFPHLLLPFRRGPKAQAPPGPKRASVVVIREATDTASAKAVRTTLVGSMMPAWKQQGFRRGMSTKIHGIPCIETGTWETLWKINKEILESFHMEIVCKLIQRGHMN